MPFNLSRILNLMRLHWNINRKIFTWLFIFLSLLIIGMLAFELVIEPSGYNQSRIQVILIASTIGICFLNIFIFKPLLQKEGASLLILPASLAEKALVAFIISYIIFPACCIITGMIIIKLTDLIYINYLGGITDTMIYDKFQYLVAPYLRFCMVFTLLIVFIRKYFYVKLGLGILVYMISTEIVDNGLARWIAGGKQPPEGSPRRHMDLPVKDLFVGDKNGLNKIQLQYNTHNGFHADETVWMPLNYMNIMIILFLLLLIFSFYIGYKRTQEQELTR
ncbi:hypothetical protein COR50_01845 [Chitinophaga caeni]|uniref:Uncharacterized protein n=1 Tax=Chitinophaga caeni TaxID=2029983 RepID=A0A291QQ94_9BACT|nr:hypothetical protein [Chitinophaga caeni]ATL46004.1 hypothetical protein COR50_01845 [Chitinophaga caeni]